MTEQPLLPRYPIYIPSKGRADCCYTARRLLAEKVPFSLVVEPQEADSYAAQFGRDRLLVLPFRDRGTVVPARNFIWEHALATGSERHWMIDDNIRYFYRRYRGKRLRCDAGIALRVCEDFTDRYENIAISGLNYVMFAPDEKKLLPLQKKVGIPPYCIRVMAGCVWLARLNACGLASLRRIAVTSDLSIKSRMSGDSLIRSFGSSQVSTWRLSLLTSMGCRLSRSPRRLKARVYRGSSLIGAISTRRRGKSSYGENLYDLLTSRTR